VGGGQVPVVRSQ